MAIVNQRTELDQTIEPEVQTGTIWLYDDGVLPVESNIGDSPANAVAGRALDEIGDRGAEREAPLAINDRVGEQPYPPIPTSLTVLPATMALLALGTEAIVSAIVDYLVPGPAEVLSSCTFESSDELVATVDGTGLVTAVAAGSATITVSYTETGITVQDTVAVTVT